MSSSCPVGPFGVLSQPLSWCLLWTRGILNTLELRLDCSASVSSPRVPATHFCPCPAGFPSPVGPEMPSCPLGPSCPGSCPDPSPSPTFAVSKTQLFPVVVLWAPQHPPALELPWYYQITNLLTPLGIEVLRKMSSTLRYFRSPSLASLTFSLQCLPLYPGLFWFSSGLYPVLSYCPGFPL